jgi:hypothetical protein
MLWHLQDNSFVLKIVYPGLCQAGTLGGYATCQMRGTTPVNWLIWSQTSNPMRTGNQQVSNYVAIDVQAQYVHTHLYASTDSHTVHAHASLYLYCHTLHAHAYMYLHCHTVHALSKSPTMPSTTCHRVSMYQRLASLAQPCPALPASTYPALPHPPDHTLRSSCLFTWPSCLTTFT